MTEQPRSASTIVAYGPAMILERSIILLPVIRGIDLL
jgi:hypothetical protein